MRGFSQSAEFATETDSGLRCRHFDHDKTRLKSGTMNESRITTRLGSTGN
jgi:hypothetical protein